MREPGDRRGRSRLLRAALAAAADALRRAARGGEVAPEREAFVEEVERGLRHDAQQDRVLLRQQRAARRVLERRPPVEVGPPHPALAAPSPGRVPAAVLRLLHTALSPRKSENWRRFKDSWCHRSKNGGQRPAAPAHARAVRPADRPPRVALHVGRRRRARRRGVRRAAAAARDRDARRPLRRRDVPHLLLDRAAAAAPLRSRGSRRPRRRRSTPPTPQPRARRPTSPTPPRRGRAHDDALCAVRVHGLAALGARALPPHVATRGRARRGRPRGAERAAARAPPARARAARARARRVPAPPAPPPPPRPTRPPRRCARARCRRGAGRLLRRGRLARAVVLLCFVDDRQAGGVILNQPFGGDGRASAAPAPDDELVAAGDAAPGAGGARRRAADALERARARRAGPARRGGEEGPSAAGGSASSFAMLHTTPSAPGAREIVGATPSASARTVAAAVLRDRRPRRAGCRRRRRAPRRGRARRRRGGTAAAAAGADRLFSSRATAAGDGSSSPPSSPTGNGARARRSSRSVADTPCPAVGAAVLGERPRARARARYVALRARVASCQRPRVCS